MVFERIDGIVRGAEQSDVGLLDDLAYAHAVFGELFICEIPNLLAGLGRKNAFVTEVTLQLQMRPMVERVADERRKRTCERFKLFIIVGISRDHALGKSAGAHGAPFVVIGTEPDLRDISILFIFGNFFRIYVTMVVNDGHFRCIMMIQDFCSLRIKQKIFVHKRFHCFDRPFLNVF